jgi:hypothetical protein
MRFHACSILHASAAVNRDTRSMKVAMAETQTEGAQLTRRWTAALRDYCGAASQMVLFVRMTA